MNTASAPCQRGSNLGNYLGYLKRLRGLGLGRMIFWPTMNCSLDSPKGGSSVNRRETPRIR